MSISVKGRVIRRVLFHSRGAAATLLFTVALDHYSSLLTLVRYP
jgi:hypothetical protein